ncbi:MAG: bifunctional oligoribonuclease/PAP phosphatase NrnA [bacterium]
MKFHARMNPDIQKTYNDILSAVKKAEKIIVSSHEDPDGDSIGSQLAFARFARSLGKKITLVNQGKIPGKYLFLPGVAEILNVDNYSGRVDYDLAVIFECPSPERLGKVVRLLPKEAPLINIDHHPDNSLFGNINLLNSRASSVGEMLVEFFNATGQTIDREMAVSLYAAILTDTGRFRYNSTTRRTMEIAGQLIELGADPREICDRIYYAMPQSLIRLTATALANINFYEQGKICLMLVDRKMLEQSRADYSDLDGLADYTLYGNGVIVGGLIKEIEKGRTKVSLRSRDRVDVSRVAHKYGGGGHHNAAGFAVNLPVESVSKVLLEDLRKMVNGKL